MKPSAMHNFPPAWARISCGNERHAIRWETGDVIALNHADPEGELGLAALGGTSCPCVDVLGAWTRHRDDPRLLSALTRGISDTVHAGRDPHGPRLLQRAVRSGSGRGILTTSTRRRAGGGVVYTTTGTVSGRAVPRRFAQHNEPAMAEDDLVLLADLGRTMSTRLVATTTARLLEASAAEPAEARFRPALEASLFGRAASALRTWTGDSSSDVVVDVVEPGAETVTVNQTDDTVRVALPLEWVSEVWGRDLAIVGGQFALAVSKATKGRTTLRTIGADFETLSSVTITEG